MIDGNGGNNYAVTFVNTTTGVINTAADHGHRGDQHQDLRRHDRARRRRRRSRAVLAGSRGDTANFSEAYAEQERRDGQDLSRRGTVNDGNGGNNYAVTFVNNTTGVINKAPLSVEPNPKTSTRQYTDPNPAFAPNYTGFVNGETASALTTAPTCSTTATPLGSIPSTTPYPVTCTGGVGTNYAFTYVAGTLTVTKEDASMDYTGDTIGLTGTNANLRATVWDSAAAGSGFTGDTTIGDITKMYVQFDIYTATSCGTGTPTATKTAQVSDTGTTGDGIGTATATYTSSIRGELLRRREADREPRRRQRQRLVPVANQAEAAVITFYNNTGQFVTGGGWVNRPGGRR